VLDRPVVVVDDDHGRLVVGQGFSWTAALTLAWLTGRAQP
jgi:hypothetical protein